MKKNTLKIDVQRCARCGQNHTLLVFKPMNDHDTYSHFAMCPTTDQPVLLYIQDIKGVES